MSDNISEEASNAANEEYYELDRRSESRPGAKPEGYHIQLAINKAVEETNLNWVNKLTALGIRFDVGQCAWVNDAMKTARRDAYAECARIAGRLVERKAGEIQNEILEAMKNV